MRASNKTVLYVDGKNIAQGHFYKFLRPAVTDDFEQDKNDIIREYLRKYIAIAI